MPQPSLLLIHGPATGAWLWEAWRRELAALGWQVIVLDLRGHGLSMPAGLPEITLQDYVADVDSVCSQIAAAQGVHPVLGGWGTGALVTMMYASEQAAPPALLLFSPAMPLEVAGRAPIDAVRAAAGETLGPEVFGVYPEDREASRAALPELTAEELDRLLEHIAGERESGIAYRQVLRGISIAPDGIQAPCLVIHTKDEAAESASLAAHLRGESLIVPDVGRWGIVLHDQAVKGAAPAVDDWLRRILGDL